MMSTGTKDELSHQLKIRENRHLLTKMRQEESEIIDKLQKLKLNCWKLACKRKKTFSMYNTRQKIEWKVGEIESLEHHLYELYVSKRPHQRKDSHVCSVDENFNKQIVKLHKGTHHGNVNFVKERRLLKHIKQSREEIEKINANVPKEPAIQVRTDKGNVLDSKEAITDYIKVTSKEVEELKKKRMRYKAYDGRLDFEQAGIEKEIRTLEKKLDKIKQRKSKTIYALQGIHLCMKG